jgi:hypothetical protein
VPVDITLNSTTDNLGRDGAATALDRFREEEEEEDDGFGDLDVAFEGPML